MISAQSPAEEEYETPAGAAEEPNSSVCPESQHEVRASCESESRSARVERSDGQEQRDLESWRDVELGWRSDMESWRVKSWRAGESRAGEM